jgi:hypothetical protein
LRRPRLYQSCSAIEEDEDEDDEEEEEGRRKKKKKKTVVYLDQLRKKMAIGELKLTKRWMNR